MSDRMPVAEVVLAGLVCCGAIGCSGNGTAAGTDIPDLAGSEARCPDGGGCSAGDGRGLADPGPTLPDGIGVQEVVVDVLPSDAGGEWVFDRQAYPAVQGWILLDADPDAVAQTLQAAAGFGVNHVQLSHDLIMNVEDVLGDDQATQARIETLNLAISLAHQQGMDAYVWTHELSGVDAEVCYAPDDALWEQRAQAYRAMFERLPGLDGVVLMFGSAPIPPWFTLCGCEWCTETYPDGTPLDSPPPAERIRIVTEKIGGVVVNELGRQLYVRTFVHEPAEIPWHGEGLAAVDGVEFTGMHKGSVQDWQPYNPHDPNTGHVGPHPSVLELDLAGEYYGLSVLPFCAPGYYWYRMDHLWKNQGIGVVSRVQRGSAHALSTPNEVNLLAVRRLVEDHDEPLAAIWDEFLGDFYGVTPDLPQQPVLKRILADTFPIRLKSHYTLGIWSMEKGSGFPDGTTLDEFTSRGKMPKWDPDWQGVWDRLDKPDRATVLALWQEGTEAVDMAAADRDALGSVSNALSEEHRKDLERRLLHQWLAARAWRAMDLSIFSLRAKAAGNDFPERSAWLLWARAELETVRSEMEQGGLGSVAVASPDEITQFLSNCPKDASDGVEPAAPDELLFSPLVIEQPVPVEAVVTFTVNREVAVFLDYGLEIPDFGQTMEIPSAPAGELRTVTLKGLEPDRRYVLRLRAEEAGAEYLGGDFWVFTR
jgi:hypothetical protein